MLLDGKSTEGKRFLGALLLLNPWILLDLNLKLMRWRALPSLDLNMLSATKCLLVGAGTLGCQVARMLMEVEGIVMAIPMPGHPVPSQEENRVLQDCRRLQDLIDSHDAVFLLTDTRESRWLPTLLCASANKITITAALGFDSFLVMRHGAGPLSAKHELKAESVNALSPEMGNFSLKEGDGRQRLGCYFCSDVVAPIDSRTCSYCISPCSSRTSSWDFASSTWDIRHKSS